MMEMQKLAICELSIDEIDATAGATDWRVVAGGLVLGVAAIAASPCPPLAGAIGSLAVHTVAVGLVID